VGVVLFVVVLGNSRTLSGLVGLIWQVRDDLSFDLAVRHAITDGRQIDELRAGLTFSFPVRLPSTAERMKGATSTARSMNSWSPVCAGMNGC
jgi:hypothetical protein